MTSTDVRRQQFKGCAPGSGGPNLWLDQQGILQSVVFYRHQDGGRRELAVTHVAENSVVGDMLLPAATTASQPLAQLEAPASRERWPTLAWMRQRRGDDGLRAKG